MPRCGDKMLRMMTRSFADQFALEWIEAWNSHDLERILSHYAEDASMSSPFIAQIVGIPSGILQGKPALRAYWSAA
jgi:ketosteroid isomerase-like protein